MRQHGGEGISQIIKSKPYEIATRQLFFISKLVPIYNHFFFNSKVIISHGSTQYINVEVHYLQQYDNVHDGVEYCGNTLLGYKS